MTQHHENDLDISEAGSTGPVAGTPQRDGEPDPEVATLTGDDPRLVAYFGPSHRQLSTFASLLAEEGVRRGLLGPREVPRLWERHLVNSASVASLLPEVGTVVDVGTGAGLPGVVLAVLRPDLHLVLLEPMERRVAWLHEVVAALSLSSVEVVRGRAEDAVTMSSDAVTARAVAPLDRLVGWTLPLLRAGGQLLAMKGERAAAELEQAAPKIRSLGGGPGDVIITPTIAGVPGTRVVRIVRELVVPRATPETSRKAERGRSEGRPARVRR